MKMRVRMLTKEGSSPVSDGSGRDHGPGTTPLLDVHVADLFVEKGFAAYIDRWPVRQGKRLLWWWQSHSRSEKHGAIRIGLAVVAGLATACAFLIKN